MSYELAWEGAIFIQRLLRTEGLYTGEPSDEWTSRILKLRAKIEARKFMYRMVNARFSVRIISGIGPTPSKMVYFVKIDREVEKGRIHEVARAHIISVNASQ